MGLMGGFDRLEFGGIIPVEHFSQSGTLRVAYPETDIIISEGPDLDLFEKLFDVEGAEGFILFQNVVAIVDWISLLFHY